MTNELLANCEECGTPIPVEVALCDACRGNDFDTCDQASSRCLSNSDADFRDRD